jgi:hypothetical protein
MMLLKLKAVAATGVRCARRGAAFAVHLVGSVLSAVAATLRALSNVVHNVGSAISPK